MKLRRMLSYAYRVSGNVVFYLKNVVFYKKYGFGSRVYKQIILQGRKGIEIGRNVRILKNGRLSLIRSYLGEKFDPQLIIGDDSEIHQNCHITCAEKITLGKSVILVSNVTVTDIIHPYEDIYTPINKTKLITRPVVIGDQTYIYNNSVILPGSIIGKHCIIGANSLVNSNIPDYSVAVGNPAKIIKRFSLDLGRWEKV